MALPLLAMVAGLALLAWSADRFVDGSLHVASRLGVSKLLIGMVVVGFGTSAPEILVSAVAAWDGQSQLAIGNAYGSNIANLGLILGLAALAAPIAVGRTVLRWELPLLTAATLAGLAFFLDGRLSRLDAAATLAVFALAMYLGLRRELRLRSTKTAAPPAAAPAPVPAIKVLPDGTPEEDTIFMPPPKATKLLDAHTVAAAPAAEIRKEERFAVRPMAVGRAVFWVVAGLALMVVASRLLVYGTVSIATACGVSQLVIGLTVVSVGTSLPELAATIVAARKGEGDLALGNLLGSNLFNTLAVVGTAGMILPFAAPEGLLRRDVPAMLGFTAALFALGWAARGKTGWIGRGKGAFLVAAYAGYVVLLCRG